MDTTLRDETAYLEMVQDRKGKIMQLQKELEEQQEKLERVQKQVRLQSCRKLVSSSVTWSSGWERHFTTMIECW